MKLQILVQKFKEKDPRAFESLYEMYYKNVLGIIFNIVRNHELAEELTQDVFVKAWNNSNSYSEEKGRFFTWLLNIARNTAIDTTRSRAYNEKYKNLDAQVFVDILEDQTDLNAKIDTIGLKRFVSKLTHKCKRIIELIYFKGHTQKETSEILKIPLGTVKTRNRKCLNNLRRMLE